MDWTAFADWIGKIQPGSWSEWVGSILTAGSLLLGFSILRRDRTKDRRQQAYRILTWFEEEKEPADSPSGPRFSSIIIKNTSDLPVFNLMLLVRPLVWYERGVLDRMANEYPAYPYKVVQQARHTSISLQPENAWIHTFPFSKDEAEFYSVTLFMKDYAGVIHYREVGPTSSQKFASLGRLMARMYFSLGFLMLEMFVRKKSLLSFRTEGR